VFDDEGYEDVPDRSWWRTLLLPVVVLLVIVGIVSALMFSGALQGDAVREAPSDAPTTVPTVEVAP